MSKQLKKVKNNIKYIKVQIERFMRYDYGVKYTLEVYGKKSLDKEGYYSKLDFQKGKPVALDISYNLLAKGKKEDILRAAMREAIKVVLWYKKMSYKETSRGYIRELRRYKLPVYGNERQTGKNMHTYGCSKCKKIYIMRDHKLSPKQDITEQNKLTACCQERFEYMDKVYYTGEDLYRISRHLQKGGS